MWVVYPTKISILHEELKILLVSRFFLLLFEYNKKYNWLPFQIKFEAANVKLVRASDPAVATDIWLLDLPGEDGLHCLAHGTVNLVLGLGQRRVSGHRATHPDSELEASVGERLTAGLVHPEEKKMRCMQ